MLNRLKRHEKKFFDFGNKDKPWVKYKYSLKKNKGMSVNEKNKNNNDNIIGFYACKFCLNSLRSNKGNPHPNSRQRAEKYDRQAIIDIEYDFSVTPEWIERVSWNIRDYIQFGIIYSHSTYWRTLKTLTMFGDSRQRLNNGQFDFITIHKKLEVITYNHSVLIENAIKWLRRNNHLSEVFTTIYELEEIKKAAIVIEGDNLLQPNDYILIDPNNIDREYQEYQIIEKLGRRFIFSKDMPDNIKDQRDARSSIYRTFKSVVFYNEQYLEEKLFVHFFPTGRGGFNSTFSKCMPLN